ncbi:hypothetical protein M2266_005920 [Streptomyces sp. SPB162]|nr:hypothetical protein [Streptomyces sp. SPB162]
MRPWLRRIATVLGYAAVVLLVAREDDYKQLTRK